MSIIFYIASLIAIASTVMVISQTNAVHALLYLIVSLLSIAVIFFILGAHFVAALEVIIYAGAIMMLFIFVIMMLNVTTAPEMGKNILSPKIWIGPSILTLILFVEFIYVLLSSNAAALNFNEVTPKQVGTSLFTTYLLGVELSALLLMSGIVGAYHLGKRKKQFVHRFLEGEKK